MASPIGNMVIRVDLDGSGFNKGVTGLQRQMRMVNKEMSANLSQFGRYDNSLEKSKAKVDGLSKRQRVQKEVVKELRQNYDRLSAETGENSAKTQAAAAKYNEARAKLNLYDRELEEATKHMKSLQDHQRAINTSLGKLGNNFSKFGPQLKTMGEGMKNIGRSMGLYVTAPIVAGFGAAAKKSIDFDDSMRKVKATSGATGNEFNQLRKKALEMGAKTKFSASESADALNYMALAGWDSKQMMSGISGVMDLAAASGEDLGQVSDIVTDSLTAFGMEAKDSSRFADVLAQTSSKANTDVKGLGDAFKYAAPVAGALGYSVEDTSIAIGLMSNAGIKGEKAGTALRTMFTNLSKPTKAMKDKMDELGISITDSNGEMLPMRDVIDQLRGKMSGLSKDQQAAAAATIFGKESMSGALAVVNASDEDYQKLTKSIDGSKGASKRMAKEMEGGIGGSLRKMKSAIESLAISIGDVLAPFIRKLADGIASIATKLTNMHGWVQGTIVAFGVLVAAIGPVLFVFGAFISVMGSAMTTLGPLLIGISKAGGLMAFLSGKVATAVRMFPALGTAISFAGGPLLWIVGGLTALGIGFTIAYKKSETFRNIVNKAVSGVMNTFKAAKIALQGFFQLFKGNGQDGVITLSKILPPDVVVGLTNFATTVKRVFFQVINAIKTIATSIGSQLNAFWSKNGTEIMSAVKNIGSAISTTFKFIWNNIIKPIMTLIWNLMKLLWPAIKMLIVSVWNNIKGVIQGALNIILGVIKVFSSLLTGNWKGVWQGIVQILKGAVQLAWNLVQLWFVGKILKVVKVGLAALKGVVTKNWKFIHTFIATIVYAIWNKVKAAFNGLYKSTRSIFTNLSKWTRNLWTALKNRITSIGQSIWTNIRNKFNGLYKSTRSIFTSLSKWSRNLWTNLKNAITKLAQNIWTNVRNKFTGMFKSVRGILGKLFNSSKNIFTNIKNSVTNLAHGARDNVVNGFKAMYNKGKSWIDKLKNFLKDSVSGFKSIAKKVGNGVANGAIGGLNAMIDGINSLSDKIMSKKLIKKKIPTLSTGTGFSPQVETDSNGLLKRSTKAIVNDKGPGNGTGPNGHKELIYRRSGKIERPIGNNKKVTLRRGDGVLNGAQSQSLLPHLSTGTIPEDMLKKARKHKKHDEVHGDVPAQKGGGGNALTAIADSGNKAWNWTTKQAKKAKDTFGKAIGDVWDYASNPMKLVNKMLKHFGVDFSDIGGAMGGTIKWAYKGLKKGVETLLTGWFDDSGGDGDSSFIDLSKGINFPFSPNGKAPGYPFNSPHYGVDLNYVYDKLYSVFSGKATARNGYNGGFGKMVDIVSGATKVIYGHMSKHAFSGSKQVKPGDYLGVSGNTGRSSGPHLHFEVQKNGVPIDPLNWLKKNNGKSGGSKAASKWRGDIIRAGKAMSVKLSSGDIQDIISLIHTESGGRAGVTQSGYTDVNTGGNEARGLLQYTPRTWNAYKAKGAGNILNGYHQLKTFFNNNNWRRDLASWKARMSRGQTGWGPTGSRRFATGGKVWDGLYHLGEEGYPEWIIPSDPKRSEDSWKLLALAANDLEKNSPKSKRPNNLPNPSTGSGSTNSNLEKKFDMLLSLVSKLVSSNEEIANKDYEPVIDKYSLENEVFKLIEKYERTKKRKGKFVPST